MRGQHHGAATRFEVGGVVRRSFDPLTSRLIRRGCLHGWQFEANPSPAVHRNFAFALDQTITRGTRSKSCLRAMVPLLFWLPSNS